ncbi:MAG: hypothetical protein H0W76_19540 [Pyrinomonadaceae bacterium]|nr:hypothetical protein [Pyrinomonadaceae bacterium]
MWTRFLVLSVGVAAVVGSYWNAADPPTPWIFPLALGGLLFILGTLLWKRRAGKI